MRVRVGDVNLYFDVAGMGLVPDGPIMREKPVLVCLHGGPGFDHTSLKHYLAPLQDVAQLVFLDQRGNGRSDRSSSERWNLATWITDVKDFCTTLGLERPIILGQSFGGIVALGVAIRYPDLPAGLIVSSSIARFRLDRSLLMFERLGGETARTIAERYWRAPTEENFNEFNAICLPLFNTTAADPDVLSRVIIRQEVDEHFSRGESATFNWFGQLDQIRCPTLILAGELDPVTTVADHEEMAAAIRGSKLRVFARAGHGVFRDLPEEALAVIRDFVRSQTENARSTSPAP